jgi:hypothetical protein
MHLPGDTSQHRQLHHRLGTINGAVEPPKRALPPPSRARSHAWCPLASAFLPPLSRGWWRPLRPHRPPRLRPRPECRLRLVQSGMNGSYSDAWMSRAPRMPALVTSPHGDQRPSKDSERVARPHCTAPPRQFALRFTFTWAQCPSPRCHLRPLPPALALQTSRLPSPPPRPRPTVASRAVLARAAHAFHGTRYQAPTAASRAATGWPARSPITLPPLSDTTSRRRPPPRAAAPRITHPMRALPPSCACQFTPIKPGSLATPSHTAPASILRLRKALASPKPATNPGPIVPSWSRLRSLEIAYSYWWQPLPLALGSAAPSWRVAAPSLV